MNLVDSCGWLEYLTDGPNAGFFEKPLSNKKKLLVPTICIYEVFKKIHNYYNENKALEIAALMYQGRIADTNHHIALLAAKISIDHKLPMADSIIMATAQAYNATIWTQDAHFSGIKGINYIPRQ